MTEAILSEAPVTVIHAPVVLQSTTAAPPPDRDLASAPDDSLVHRSQMGNRPAFEQLVHRSAKLVFARIYLESGRADRTEDLVQETYLVAWRSIGQLTDAAVWRSWLLSIAHSVVVDSARHDARKKRGGGSAGFTREMVRELESMPATSPGPPELAGQAETRRLVLDVLRSLPEDYRLPLTMRYLHGADYETIARQLGITNGSLRGLLNRGVTLLRQELTRLGIEM